MLEAANDLPEGDADGSGLGHHWFDHLGEEAIAVLGAKLVTQIVWYGSVRTPFTFDFAEELLRKAGFASVQRCAFRRTASSYPQIVELDNRERESLFVEAVK